MNQAVTYVLLVLPALLAATVFGQGTTKLSRGDESGKTDVGFGIFLFVLIGAAYFLFIR